jgi:hypothetical protein
MVPFSTKTRKPSASSAKNWRCHSDRFNVRDSSWTLNRNKDQSLFLSQIHCFVLLSDCFTNILFHHLTLFGVWNKCPKFVSSIFQSSIIKCVHISGWFTYQRLPGLNPRRRGESDLRLLPLLRLELTPSRCLWKSHQAVGLHLLNWLCQILFSEHQAFLSTVIITNFQNAIRSLIKCKS